MKRAATITPVILCGGAGSRLWPASRESYPKQFAVFGGEMSLFQGTLARIKDPGFASPIVVASEEHRFIAAEQARAVDVDCEIMLEPVRRDSCMAVAVAACRACARNPEAVVLVLASDHALPSNDEFLKHVRGAYAAAEAGYLVTFGIKPAYPATGFGYLRPGDVLNGMGEVRELRAFIEKPEPAVAEQYVRDGYLWNSGNFLFKAKIFLEELAAFAPEICAAAKRAVSESTRDLDFIRLDRAAFEGAPSISIDYAVMEKTAKAAVMPSTFAWSDVGSWASVWTLADRDADGNAFDGHAVFDEARNSYVHSPYILTAVLGVDDIVVVTTRDAVLVTSRSRSEDVKALVGKLAREGRREAKEHLRAYRPWGDYEQIDRGPRYQVKRITVMPGGKLSLQSHAQRAEHWVVVTGRALVTIDGKESLLGENQSAYIPVGALHRLENPGPDPLELIEVQSGAYLGEDDIVRYEDIYNRS